MEYICRPKRIAWTRQRTISAECECQFRTALWLCDVDRYVAQEAFILCGDASIIVQTRANPIMGGVDEPLDALDHKLRTPLA